MRSRLERAVLRAACVGCASAIVACAAQVAGPSRAVARPDAPTPSEAAHVDEPVEPIDDSDLKMLEDAAAAAVDAEADCDITKDATCLGDLRDVPRTSLDATATDAIAPACFVLAPTTSLDGALEASVRDDESDALANAATHIDAAPTATLAISPEPLAEPAFDTSMCAALPEAALAVPTQIEDPSGVALQGFHDALQRARAGEGQARIVFYGASHVASDLYTGLLRRKLQASFGNAGPGFFLPGRPWRFYRHEGLSFAKTRGLRTRRIKASRPHGDAYGLAGVVLDAFTDRPASAAFDIAPSALRADEPVELELYFARRANGGTVRLLVDGAPLTKVRTSGAGEPTGYARIAVPSGARHIELRTDGDGPVRIYGVSLEHASAGVVLDTLGIPGSRARYHLLWDDTLYREHLARRAADLVVLAYGTNEAGDDLPIETYEAELRKTVARVREVAPRASCLLVGPSDRPLRPHPGVYAPRTRTEQIVAAQRRVSAELGCGFFDVVAFMGGPMSMARWVQVSPPLGTPDHVHFTRAGYELLGNALHDALLAGSGLDSGSIAAATAQRDEPRTTNAQRRDDAR